jgi:hypothetical protein
VGVAEIHGGSSIGAMNKKKAKRTRKKATKKSGKTKSTRRRRATSKRKEPRPAEVRKEVSRMVESEAKVMAKAVIDEGKKGQLATVKYLFEVAEIFPPGTQTTEGSAREDSLAETLLHRLNIPIEPIQHDEDDGPVIIQSSGQSDAHSSIHPNSHSSSGSNAEENGGQPLVRLDDEDDNDDEKEGEAEQQPSSQAESKPEGDAGEGTDQDPAGEGKS